MSETKFTPGPWKLVVEDDDCGQNFVIRMGDAIRSPHAHTACNAFTYYEGADPDYENPDYYQQVVANAHLIASAPDLYAALERLQRRIVEADLWHGQEDELSAATAALAKARGER